MNKEFIPYEQSLQLKELGFDEPCFGFYLNQTLRLDGKIEYCSSQEKNKYVYEGECLSPTFSQVFRWFREKHGFFIQPNRTIDSMSIWYYFSISSNRTYVCDGSFVYKEAELECLKKLIEIVKEN